MLTKGGQRQPQDAVTPEEEIKDPFVLEFLGLKDEYSESEIEEALILHLERFILELGGDFTFVGRQRRLRVGDTWYRIDLIFFHRSLRCLVVIDLKLGSLTHADAGQMHLYLNYAREHWTRPDENPPVGLILCAKSSNSPETNTMSRRSGQGPADEVGAEVLRLFRTLVLLAVPELGLERHGRDELVDVVDTVPAPKRAVMRACRNGEVAGAARVGRRWLASR